MSFQISNPPPPGERSPEDQAHNCHDHLPSNNYCTDNRIRSRAVVLCPVCLTPWVRKYVDDDWLGHHEWRRVRWWSKRETRLRATELMHKTTLEGRS